MKRLILLCLLMTTCAYAGFSDFTWSSFNLGGGGVCKEQKPVLTVTPTSYAFGNQSTGTTHSTNIVLSNTGNAALTSITFGAFSSAVFTHSSSATSPCGTTLAAKATCYRKVSFTPAAATAYSDALVVSSNQLDDVMVAVSGTGVSSELPTGTILLGDNADYSANTNRTLTANRIYYVQLTAANSGYLRTGKYWEQLTAHPCKIVITDSAGNILETSSEHTSTYPGWNTVTFSGTVWIAAGATYKIGLFSGYDMRPKQGNTNTVMSYKSSTYPTVPDPLDQTGTASVWPFSMYVTN